MIDFTNCEKKKKKYEGANGGKISVVYEGELYMLKFPPVSKRNKMLSYKNDCISEYIACHILQTIGLNVQQTLLGTYNVGGKEKLVVACKDFTDARWTLIPFAGLKNETIDTPTEGYNTDLGEILTTFNSQTDFPPSILKEHFWNMFIGDALIGNWDRHNGNWGFLYNRAEDKINLSPIYDCGSSLYPSADEQTMELILSNENEMKVRIYERPFSALKINQENIKYFDFISSLENADCNAALKRIFPKINMEHIFEIVEQTPAINDLQKRFYKTMLKERYERILLHSYMKL